MNRVDAWVQWTLPKDDYIKINVRSFFTEDPLPNGNRSGISIIFRDDRGTIIRVRPEHRYVVRQLNSRKADKNTLLDITLINEESNRLAMYLAKHGAHYWTSMLSLNFKHEEDLEDAMNDGFIKDLAEDDANNIEQLDDIEIM
ncbi:hypothetical protein POM88_020935 [Heracleum sosnowskyi]|uniref:Uncharacterized protein n=1 Tax=Heracleum sosnowskyi TaxID=360622 RepID=A0AAD8IFY9_9APIA|nr:hypothetical protein POM88_020935 [Heracleum sosnowskyi]